jgi:hypothetical protein
MNTKCETNNLAVNNNECEEKLKIKMNIIALKVFDLDKKNKKIDL